MLLSKLLPRTLIATPFFVMFSGMKMLNPPPMLAHASVGAPSVRMPVSDPSRWTFPVALQNLVGQNNVEWANLMAAGAISPVPMVILLLILGPFPGSGLAEGPDR